MKKVILIIVLLNVVFVASLCAQNNTPPNLELKMLMLEQYPDSLGKPSTVQIDIQKARKKAKKKGLIRGALVGGAVGWLIGAGIDMSCELSTLPLTLLGGGESICPATRHFGLLGGAAVGGLLGYAVAGN